MWLVRTVKAVREPLTLEGLDDFELFAVRCVLPEPFRNSFNSFRIFDLPDLIGRECFWEFFFWILLPPIVTSPDEPLPCRWLLLWGFDLAILKCEDSRSAENHESLPKKLLKSILPRFGAMLVMKGELSTTT